MSKVLDIGDYSDLELERQVLHFIATVDSSLIPHIDVDVFYGSDERVIFEVLKELQTHFPEKLLRDILLKKLGAEIYEDIEQTVDSILRTPKVTTIKAAETLISSLYDIFVQRSIIENADAAINFAKEEMIPEAMESVSNIVRAEARKKIESGNYIEDYEERKSVMENYSQMTGERSILIPTGIVPFDNIAGGLKKGEVGVVVGRTGGGKSTAKLNFAAHAFLQGFNVIFVGLEMSKHENEFRADSLLASLPGNLFRFASLTERDYKAWDKTIKDLKKSRKNYLEFVGAKNLTLSEILSVVEGIETSNRKPCDLLVIDHLVLIKGEGRQRDFHMQQWDTFERISEWAVKHNKAVWTSSQSTDEGVTRKKGMRVIDVKYSRAIAELANVLLALYQSEIDEASGDLNLAIRKGRGMKAGDEIVLKPDFSKMILDTKSFVLNRLSQLDDKTKRKSRKEKKANRGTL